MSAGVEVTGSAEARRTLASLGAECERFGRTRFLVASYEPYAYGIETGRHARSGRVARAAGGAYMFRRGVEASKAQGIRIVGRPGHPLDGQATIEGKARQTATFVRGFTPRRSGRLQGSVKVYRAV